MTTLALNRKYRPRKIGDLILPVKHGLKPVFQLLKAPYPSEWLFTGKSGLGKTSLAEILAQEFADTNHIRRFVGSDLDANRVKEIETSVLHRPLYGRFHFFHVDEADEITHGGQVRLLKALEVAENCIWVFTSNEGTEGFESRFLSRVRHVNFTSQGILEPAAVWLANIAKREEFNLSLDEATKIVRTTKNNLRTSLQELELRILDAQHSELDLVS